MSKIKKEVEEANRFFSNIHQIKIEINNFYGKYKLMKSLESAKFEEISEILKRYLYYEKELMDGQR